jgi:hypothetical protein
MKVKTNLRAGSSKDPISYAICPAGQSMKCSSDYREPDPSEDDLIW